MDSNGNSTRFENLVDIVDKGGWNRKTVKSLINAILANIVIGFYLTYFYYIIIPFQKYYDLSDFMVMMISSTNFLGFFFGNLLSGVLSQKFDRKTIIIFAVCGNLICHLLHCTFRNIIMFTIFRTLSSLFVGFYEILVFSIYCEYLPIYLRGFFLNLMFATYFLGAIFFLLICKIYLPNLNFNPYIPEHFQDFHAAILQFSIVILLCLVSSIFFMEDSPRNLIMNNQLEKAKEILNFYTEGRINDEDMKTIARNLKNKGENQYYEEKNGISSLFKKRNFFLTIKIMMIFFFLCTSYYGIQSTLTTILKGIGTDSNEIEDNEKSESPINSLLIMGSIESLGNFTGAILCEFEFIGRKYLLVIMSIISIGNALLGRFVLSKFEIFMGIGLSASNLTQDCLKTYTSEIYPTKIRDLALGINISVMRIAGIFSQFVFFSLTKLHLFSGIYMFLAFTGCALVTILLLPPDNNKEIDAEVEMSDNESSESETDEILKFNSDDGNNDIKISELKNNEKI